MDYEHVTHEEMLEKLDQAIAGQEREHYQKVIERIANDGNPSAIRAIDNQLAIRQRAIVQMRNERDRLKAAAPAPTETQEPPPPGLTHDEPTAPDATPATP